MKLIWAGPLALLFSLFAAYGQNDVSVRDLRCEYLVNPMGIDVTQPRLSWAIGSSERGIDQSAYQVLVASTPENLRNNVGNLWDSGRVISSQSTFVLYGGHALDSGMRCYWKVRIWLQGGGGSSWSEPAMWSMGLLRSSDWKGRWIGEKPVGAKEGTPLPFPWFRKIFELKQKPRLATAYVNALGYYELYVNGRKVDDQVLAPAVSDYSKRNYYVTHDITGYLSTGTNCVALWLGRGWYVRGHPGVIHDGPLVRAQMDITLADGTRKEIVTDSTWKARESPIMPLGKGTAFGDYGGERYDARLELEGWNSAGLNDSDWRPADLFDPPRVRTTAQMVEPNRILRTFSADKIEESPAGAWLIDMGRNFTGWLEIRLPAGMPAGTSIRVEYADTPPAGGRYMTFNQRDEFITRDGGGQVIRSRFNYHAFRYAHVVGLDRKPALEDIKGYFIRTAYEPASEFESSDELMDRIYKVATWTYQCLTLGGYVVDCPTRERLGYGGDAGTSIETGMFNFDVGALYTKWSGNWRDAQDPATGDLPYTAPAYPDQGGGGPMWSGFCVTLPWHLYTQYGDKRILDVNYPTIQKWLAFAESKTKDHILEPYISYGIRMPQWNYLGDWVTPKRPGSTVDAARSPVAARFINNCHYLYTLQLASKIAAVLNKDADAVKYRDMAAALARILQERFFHPENDTYATGEQAYLAFPLLIGIVPNELRSGVLKQLEQTIRVKNSGHVDTGMHGTYFMLKLLMEQDRNDLIYEMASKTTYPSWGYMLDHGATTFWEDWSGGSHIHDTLISIGSWFIQGIGGIRIDERSPGFSHFFIKPAPVGALKFARTKYKSIHGWIASDWRLDGGSLQLDVTVPPGTTATIELPGYAPEQVTEGGQPATSARGVRSVPSEKGKTIFLVSSGHFEFAAKRAGRAAIRRPDHSGKEAK